MNIEPNDYPTLSNIKEGAIYIIIIPYNLKILSLFKIV